MRGALARWIRHVVFWGFILSLLFGGLITAATGGKTNGFALEGKALVSLFHDLGALFGPLWNAITGKHGVTVH